MEEATLEEPRPFGFYAPTGFVRWAVEATRALPDTWLGRRALILMRRVVAARLRGAPVDVEALGARMRVYPYNNICEKRMLFAPATFDPQELQLIEARLRPGFAFIDIGANVGAYSLFVAAKAGPDARILAIEPQPRIFERLVGNVRINSFANVKAIACAVADRAGELTLFVDGRNSGESSVKIIPSGAATSVKVPARTLLAILREEGFERVDAMKLDVEGAEDLTLEPFFRDAPPALWPGLLVIEDGVGRWGMDLPGLLAAKGYRRLAKTRLNLVFGREGEGAGHG